MIVFEYAMPSVLKSHINSPVLAFTGAMDYHANVDGVCWFCREIFPLVKKEFPDLEFYIVGRNPSSQVKKLDTIPGVEVALIPPSFTLYKKWISPLIFFTET